MIKFMLLLIVILSMFCIFYLTNIESRHWVIDKIIRNRENELQRIITKKDITYQARIEELHYIGNNLKNYID